MGEGRFRIMARIPKGQGEPEDVIKAKTTSNKLYFCSDPDIGWYKDNVPCRVSCPADTRIPEYIDADTRGNYDKAYEINRIDNVLPHILGRVCSHPCEDNCRHGFDGLGDSVSICWLKRGSGDLKTKKPKLKKAKSTGKTVAIIGSGPAGLAAAQDLTLCGHKVTIYEGLEKPGGMLRYGIPRFRLPESLIDDEIDQILDLGVDFVPNKWIKDRSELEEMAKNHDAVLTAAGSMVPHKLNIPGEDADRVVSGLDFMSVVNRGSLTKVEGKVVILGGGFTAMDCARSAWRLGASDVTIVYRRTRNELKVDDREMKEVQVEGVHFQYLLSPKEIKKNNHNSVKEILFLKNRLGEPDADGRRSVKSVEGTEFSIEADWIIPAISQDPDLAIFGGSLENSDGAYSTQIEKVFAAGDFVTGPKDIITAIGHAHAASRVIDRFLTGENRFKEEVTCEGWPQKIPDSFTGWKSASGSVQDLILRQEMPNLELKNRKSQNKEADTGYDGDETYWQSQRCFLCNHNIMIDQETCILCYNCVDVCPYDCILMLREDNVEVNQSDGKRLAEKAGHTYMVMDEEKCIRCGFCMDTCPIPCITMEKTETSVVFPA